MDKNDPRNPSVDQAIKELRRAVQDAIKAGETPIVREGGEVCVPPGLQEGGSWIPAIRAEVRKELSTGAYAQVRQRPPWFLRWLLKPWLRFQGPRPTE